MDIKTVPQRPYSPDFAPCDFCLFPKLTGCRYETIEKIKETVTKVIDTLTQEDFPWAIQKLLERYKYIAAGRDYFEGDYFFMCVLSIKVPIRKKSGNLSYAPRISLLLALFVSQLKHRIIVCVCVSKKPRVCFFTCLTFFSLLLMCAYTRVRVCYSKSALPYTSQGFRLQPITRSLSPSF